MMNMGDRKTDRQWIASYCKEYWPEECAHIMRIADDAVKGEFLFDLPWDMEQTGVPVVFDGEIDWQFMPEGDPEFIYQFNRHRYWVCLGQAYAMTGDEIYARCFAGHLMSWMERNPITEETKRTTWRTIEAGIRGENWVKAMEYFEDSPSVTGEVRTEFVKGLMLHGDYLYQCRVPFSDKSNWGVLESHGLYMIGMALRDAGAKADSGVSGGEAFSGTDVRNMGVASGTGTGNMGTASGTGVNDVVAVSGLSARSQAYMEEAVKRMERELSIQVMDDGVHWEQSPMYHNEVLRCVLEVMASAKKGGSVLPAVLYHKARAMAYVDLAWMKPDRTQPLSGDSDQTDLRDVLTPAAYLLDDTRLRFGGYCRLDFESAWSLGAEAVVEYEQMRSRKPDRTFYAMEHSGNWYLRSGWQEDADYLHFICGPLGGGHGHFDKLHIDLCICGEDVLMDSGRYTYVDGDLRRGLKSSRAHNVPMVDFKEYSHCTGSWDAVGLAPSLGQMWSQKQMEDGTGSYTLIQGSHLGYMADGVLVSRRIVSIGTRVHVIVDRFYGQGNHRWGQLFHFNPLGRVEREGNRIFYRGKRAGACLTVLAENTDVETREVPVSFHYNKLDHMAEAAVSVSGCAPISLITVITGYEAGQENPYQVESVDVWVPVAGRMLMRGEAEAVRVQDGEHSWLLAINHMDTGSDCEYIGAAGRYGLGRIMICDEKQPGDGMTVLQW